MSWTVVEVMHLARDVVGAKRDHPALVEIQSVTLKDLDLSQAAKRLVWMYLETLSAQLTTLRARLDEVWVPLAKAKESAANSESDLRARITALEKSLDKERGRYKRTEEEDDKRVATTQASLNSEVASHLATSKQLTKSGAAWLEEREQILAECAAAIAVLSVETREGALTQFAEPEKVDTAVAALEEQVRSSSKEVE